MATLNLNKKKFLSEENVAQIVKIGINFGERLNSIESKCIAPYDETHSYLKDELCIYDNYIYKCNSTATGTWNPDRWTLIGDDITELTLDEIKAMLGLTTEQLTTLSSIILDSEVRLDKTYSSSKIYTSIQDAIDTSKAYTLAEIGKASGASYKIASSTSDMTDEKVIYLLQNGSTYNMYIVDSGTPVKIGDTTIDLSGYLKIDEANNIYLKKTDATSTYATKVELGDKVDKTAIKTAISDTPSDENLLSEKYIDENIVKKTDITTTIDSSSTDTQVPSAKSVYNEMLKFGSNPNVYTLGEQVVGKWIDGKPIYRKVVNNIVYDGGDLSVNTGISNISTLIKLEFIEDGVTASVFTNYKYIGTNRRNASIRIDKYTGVVSTEGRNTSVTGDKGILIIEYTKTTD